MITVLMCIVAVLFGLYLAWIVLAAFVVAWREWKGDKSGFSFTPFVELILLPVIVLLSALSSGEAWYNHPLQVAKWGIVSVVFAYGCFMVLSFILGFIFNVLLIPFHNSKNDKTKTDPPQIGNP